MTPIGLRRAAAVGLIGCAAALGVASAGQAASTGQTTTALPQARVLILHPRVLSLKQRVVTLRERIVSVAPQHPRPNTIAVGTDVLFAFGSAELSPSAHPVLASLVAQLRRDRPGTVRVAGYTDSIGTVAYNLSLSTRRATAVRVYLTAHVGNRGLRYRTHGFGEADPVAPNTLPGGRDNPEGRARNRRVVLTYALR